MYVLSWYYYSYHNFFANDIFFLCTIEAVVEVVMEVEIAEEIIEMEVALTGIPMAGIDRVHTENFPAYIMY